MNHDLDRQFLSVYHANSDGVTAFTAEIAERVDDAMQRATGVLSYEDIFHQVRDAIPNAGDLGITPELTDYMLRMLIHQAVAFRSKMPATEQEIEQELEALNQLKSVMQTYGFKTAGEAIEFLQKRKLN